MIMDILKNNSLIENFMKYTLSGICIFSYNEDVNDFVFVFCNDAFFYHNTFLPKDIEGRLYREMLPMSLNNGMYQNVFHVYKTGETLSFTLDYYNNIRGHVFQNHQIFRIGDGYVVSMFNDVTDIKQSEENVQLEKMKYSQTIHSLASGVITTDNENRITLVNQFAMKLLSLKESNSLMGTLLSDLFEVKKSQLSLLFELVDNFDIDTIVCHNGLKLLVVYRITPLIDEHGNNKGYVHSFEDVSSFVKAQEELAYLNYHDTQTGFYNRYFLKIYTANHYATKDIGIVFCDINGLSRINDSKGMEVGDAVLRHCAQSLKNNLPQASVFIRFGEDDFIAIVPLSVELNLTKACLKIQDDFKEKCILLDTSLSIGTSIVGLDAKDIHDGIRIAQEHMNGKKIMSKQSVRSSALLSLLATLQVKSHETEEHAQRLNDLAQELAKSIHLDDRERTALSLLAVLHDIGKIGVPEYVLDKPGKLTDEEWRIMKNHTDLGYNILSSTPELEHVAHLVRAHHERWDGKGYPDGLVATEIPILARIISIVDSYDAMVNDRVYRKALTKEEALAELKKYAGTQFDPNLVPIFENVINHCSSLK